MREHLHSFSKLEFDKVRQYIQRYAQSSLGKEHLEHMLPSSNLYEIKSSLALVSEMKRLLEETGEPPIEYLLDLRTQLQRTSIENFILSAEDLLNILRLLITSRKIQSFFFAIRDHYPRLAELSKAIFGNTILEHNINLAIDDEGQVKDSASKVLNAIRREIVEKNLLLRKRLESILKSVSGKDWIQDEIITTRDARMVIPVKLEHKSRVPGFIHSTSASGATVFIEPTESLELNNDLRTLQFAEKRELEKILKQLTDQIGEFSNQLLQNIETLTALDFIIAKAKYSIEILGAEPAITNDKTIKLHNARHPVLLQRHKREEIVPLDIDIPENITTVVITGPNAGGKSVAMKTLGLLSILAQSGCHIPASPESELPIYTDMFVEMGDEQSIENDLSSFSSHLTNLKLITEQATNTSIILIDEIASGTDPTDGASIAAAILSHLTRKGCKTIATTHHGSLKAFAFETTGMMNAAMEYNQETLNPTYRFLPGIPGNSYAIEMAERLSLGRSIIEYAKQLRGSNANMLEQLIIDLEKKSQLMAQELSSVQQDKQHLNGMVREYEQRIAGLEKEIKAIKHQALTEAKSIIEKSKSVVEKTIKDIKEHQAEKSVVRMSKDLLLSAEKEIEASELDLKPTEPVSKIQLKVGDNVIIKGYTSDATILEKIDDDQFLVFVGNVKLRIHKQDITHAVKESKNTQYASTTVNVTEVKRELDLRGMYGEEAIREIEKIFDSALLSGLHRIDIIHGKGTGALRKRVTEFLKTHTSVKSFRLGEWNEGGSGVTIVELQ